MTPKRTDSLLPLVGILAVFTATLYVRRRLEDEAEEEAAEASSSALPSWMREIVEHFGVTDDPKKSGYILPDGRMLDMSDGRDERVVDHRNVLRALDTYGEGKRIREKWGRSYDAGMAEMLEAGAVRLSGLGMPTSVNLELTGDPTDEQELVMDELYQDSRIADVGLDTTRIIQDPRDGSPQYERWGAIFTDSPTPGLKHEKDRADYASIRDALRALRRDEKRERSAPR